MRDQQTIWIPCLWNIFEYLHIDLQLIQIGNFLGKTETLTDSAPEAATIQFSTNQNDLIVQSHMSQT